MEKYLNNDIFLLLISFLSTFILYKKFIPIFQIYLIDKPNLRSLHKFNSPTGGGIIFAILISIFSVFKANYIPLFSLPLSIIGLLDDKKNLSRKIRIIGQLMTIIIFLSYGFYLNNILPWIDLDMIYILILPIIFCSLGIINFLNFSDGINGLLAGSLLVTFIYYTFNINTDFIFLIPIIFVFLYFNWSPAKIFMGDSGSLYLGALYVYILLSSSSLNQILYLIFILSPILFDVLITLLRRLFNNYNIFEAHRLHLYQRLVSSRFTHSQVSCLYLFFSILFALFSTFEDLRLIINLFLLMSFIGFYLDKYIAKPFSNKEIN